MSSTICVYDFCGYIYPGHFPFSAWADWNPDTGITKFGGEWQEVPDMHSPTEPTEEQCEAWANSF